MEWGKSEEEERLTGRAETRRTLGEWTAVLLSVVAFFAAALATLFMTGNLVLRALDAGLAPPGELHWVDGDKYLVHVYCHGGGKEDHPAIEGVASKDLPTVLLEGGEDTVESSLWQLADDAVRNGSIGRYCFVDRPGMAWVSEA